MIAVCLQIFCFVLLGAGASVGFFLLARERYYTDISDYIRDFNIKDLSAKSKTILIQEVASEFHSPFGCEWLNLTEKLRAVLESDDWELRINGEKARLYSLLKSKLRAYAKAGRFETFFMWLDFGLCVFFALSTLLYLLFVWGVEL